jgi:uncharacterized RDD family membrane protein YckC
MWRDVQDIASPDAGIAGGGLSEVRVGLGRRFAAGVIDAVVVLVVMMVALAVGGSTQPDPATGPSGEHPASAADIVILALVVLVPLLCGLIEARTGQSPGKRMVGIRVVALDGRASLGLATAARRSALRWVSAIPLLAGYVASVRNPHGLAWHDQWTQTAVVPRTVTIEPLAPGVGHQTVRSPLVTAPSQPPAPILVPTVVGKPDDPASPGGGPPTSPSPRADLARPSDAVLADIEHVEHVLVEQGAIDVALAFSFALQRWSDSADRAVRTARLLHLQSYRSQAMAMLNDVVESHPGHAAARAVRAQVLVTLDQLDAARSDLRRAHDLDPSEGLAQLAASLVALRGNEPDAHRAASCFLADHPNDWLDLMALADVACGRHDWDLALSLLTGAEHAGAPRHETNVRRVRAEERIPFTPGRTVAMVLRAMWPSPGHLRLLRARVEHRTGGDRCWSPSILSGSFAARLPGLRRLWPLGAVVVLVVGGAPATWALGAILLAGAGATLVCRSRARRALGAGDLAWIDYLAELHRLDRIANNRNVPDRLRRPRVAIPADSVEASPAACQCERTFVLTAETAAAYADYHLARVRTWPGVDAAGFRCSATGISWVAAHVGDTIVLRRCPGLDLADAAVATPAPPGSGGYL